MLKARFLVTRRVKSLCVKRRARDVEIADKVITIATACVTPIFVAAAAAPGIAQRYAYLGGLRQNQQHRPGSIGSMVHGGHVWHIPAPRQQLTFKKLVICPLSFNQHQL